MPRGHDCRLAARRLHIEACGQLSTSMTSCSKQRAAVPRKRERRSPRSWNTRWPRRWPAARRPLPAPVAESDRGIARAGQSRLRRTDRRSLPRTRRHGAAHRRSGLLAIPEPETAVAPDVSESLTMAWLHGPDRVSGGHRECRGSIRSSVRSRRPATSRSAPRSPFADPPCRPQALWPWRRPAWPRPAAV
jgi:hypothetical protein